MHLRSISKIRKYLDEKTTKVLVHAFIFSKLDFVNSLLYGLPKYQIGKFQLIQNSAARIITKTKKRLHITPILKELHWLPIALRIEFKIAMITFKTLHLQYPTYLFELLRQYIPPRDLRSSHLNKLVKPCMNLKSYGERSFYYAAAKIWNNLPNNVRQAPNLVTFKRNLKTHYFTLHYI